MMMFETSKHVPKTEKRCCVFENNRFICANKTIRYLHFKGFKPAYGIANLGGLYYLHSYLQSKECFLKQLLNRYTHTITVNQYKVKTN